ncbi:hypothetical protein [Priestia aryabhattai]|uniref:hypothetical protein n=1 Tax=Priestia aryabhattai TaxID=412384 RepID=UPI0015F61028|nr:hypothetical protein [Priestia aryabhattai]
MANDLDITFSVNLHDDEGDVYSECILLHIGEQMILKVDNLKQYEDLIDQLKSMRSEIAEVWNRNNL